MWIFIIIITETFSRGYIQCVVERYKWQDNMVTIIILTLIRSEFDHLMETFTVKNISAYFPFPTSLYRRLQFEVFEYFG